jgi:hypothetical protein
VQEPPREDTRRIVIDELACDEEEKGGNDRGVEAGTE